VETLARMYVQALSLGEPPILSDEEIDIVMKQMRNVHYGPMAATE
jgi:L-fuculose-phosphate aldolase